MKHLILLFGSIILGAFGFVHSASAADVNNFVISDYKVDMQLGMDGEGRSTLKTVETITAEFPNYDQNHGIERALPKRYDDHKTNVSVASVTDGSGAARIYSTYDDDNGNLVVRMADMSKYVHGTQTYILTYTQRDVTKYFADTNDDEFYWDINGTDWRVPIQRLETHITLDSGLIQHLNGATACYRGALGSTDRCEIVRSGGQFTSIATNLGRGENVTVAIGFEPNTFTPYQMTFAEMLFFWWIVIQFLTGPVAVIILLWLVIRYSHKSGRDKELGSIAPEYLPPSDASVTVSSQITRQTRGSVMTAQLLDLAVRHYIKLYEVKEKKWYRAAEYEIEISKDPGELRAEERELLSDTFGTLPSVGDRLNLKKLRNNTAYYNRTLDNDKKIRDSILGGYGLRHKDEDARRSFRSIAARLAIFGVGLLSVPLIVMAAVALVMSYTLTPLTDKGLALRRYLKGLKMYIGVAEAERLRMLQSPEGAEKIARVVDGTDQKSLITLYERVLPYAVLFGQEKEWSKQLGGYYEQTNSRPDWYAGSGVFNAAVFTSAMSGISQAASYASSSSSSSGGSSGGGSSGGGGGGGGGGGV